VMSRVTSARPCALIWPPSSVPRTVRLCIRGALSGLELAEARFLSLSRGGSSTMLAADRHSKRLPVFPGRAVSLTVTDIVSLYDLSVIASNHGKSVKMVLPDLYVATHRPDDCKPWRACGRPLQSVVNTDRSERGDVRGRSSPHPSRRGAKREALRIASAARERPRGASRPCTGHLEAVHGSPGDAPCLGQASG
jgi:hypothetical protein